ncbi:MAG: urea ABC transporter permease subunit UrtB [Pseudomonadota bacterium]
MTRVFAFLLGIVMALPLSAQQADAPIQLLMQDYGDSLAKPSRKTIQPTIDALVESGLSEVSSVLEKWQNKEIWRNKETDLFVFAKEIDRKTIRIFDIANGEELGTVEDKAYRQLKPNSGVRGLIAGALVKFQLIAPDLTTRQTALDAIARDPKDTHLAALRDVIDGEADAGVKTRMIRLERLLTIEFGETDDERIAAIQSFEGDLGVDVRAALNPLLRVKTTFSDTPPAGDDVARILSLGEDISETDAYALLVAEEVAPPVLSPSERREVLVANIDEGLVGGVPVATLNTDAARQNAYDALVAAGVAEDAVSEVERREILKTYTFYEVYTAAPPPVALAAAAALASIENKVTVSQVADLGLDAISLASIYFLAAIGLAITFGVMGVINMAHGEFIMMGAYTGYVVQLFVTNHTLSIILAIPLAFMVTFAAGVAMERLIVRWLYHRPLETLLATFGVSIALQQIAKNIFGTQARPLTSPAWLDGSWVINDVISISYIRIAIFVLALLFLALFLFVMNRTRLGLEVRAVTQNPRMAASMGINPDKINMLTFGFGSGIAGIAGVAIGLYAKVTSEMGADYIVQSFMTVVVGGVGSIWGTLLGASMVGTLQKGIEWLNPSNTLAAQTYMILFIILFIQVRPRGIIALKGRAAEA